MKKLSQKIIQERRTKILNRIADYYIQEKKKISSRIIKDTSSIDLSSATIRSVMAVLQKEGYLKKSHKTDAYLPTAKTWRFVLEQMIESLNSFVEQKRKLTEQNNLSLRSLNIQFDEISKKIKETLPLAGFTVTGMSDSTELKYIHFLKIYRDEIKIITITDTGLPDETTVKIESESDVDDDLLKYVNILINKNCSGTPLYKIKLKMLETIDRLKHHNSMAIELLNEFIRSVNSKE